MTATGGASPLRLLVQDVQLIILNLVSESLCGWLVAVTQAPCVHVSGQCFDLRLFLYEGETTEPSPRPYACLCLSLQNKRCLCLEAEFGLVLPSGFSGSLPSRGGATLGMSPGPRAVPGTTRSVPVPPCVRPREQGRRFHAGCTHGCCLEGTEQGSVRQHLNQHGEVTAASPGAAPMGELRPLML